MADEDIDSLLEQGLRQAEERQRKEKENEDEITKDQSLSRRRSRVKKKKHHRRRSISASSTSSNDHRHRSRRSRRSSSRSSSRHRHRHSPHRRSSRVDSDSSRRRRNHRAYSRSRSRSSRRDHRKKRRKSSPSPKILTPAERIEAERQRELMELTRDHRTVFVGQLTQKVSETDIETFFRKVVGTPVENVLLMRDKFTNRSKGFAYVELSQLEDIPKVLSINGTVPSFQSFPLLVKASEAEKNFMAKQQLDPTSDHLVDHNNIAKIYVGNLHPSLSEEDVRSVFQNFGTVESMMLNRNEQGRSRGYGFVTFSSPEEAAVALAKGNGLELAGQSIKTGSVRDAASLAGPGASFSLLSKTELQYAQHSTNWKLDDDDDIGLSSQSRTALMAKLAGGQGAEFIQQAAASGLQAQTPAIVMPTPMPAMIEGETPAMEGSENIAFVMKNMFDPATERGSDWHLEIKEDVESECMKYGTVLHSYVEKDTSGGLVYILFQSIDSASKAALAMHGRWFNKRQILVRYLSSQEYVGMFPEARSAVQRATHTS